MTSSAAALAEAVGSVPLVDHHCHGIVGTDLVAADFDDMATESDWPQPPGASIFDSPFGVALRAECAPLLGLARHALAEEYLRARTALGWREVATRLLSATGIDTYVIETGHRSDAILAPHEVAGLGGAGFQTVVRLEVVAENVARSGVDAHDFAEAFTTALAEQAESAIAVKTIIAYRHGLDFDPARPTPEEVTAAAGRWLRRCQEQGRWRLDDPVLLRNGLWAGVDLGKPIQIHVGYGDSDIVLHRCDPTRMTEFIKATVDTGVQLMLLHCYPFIREAGFLAQVYPHVWLDTGAAVNYTGPSSAALIRQSLELAPYTKVLFSSDAFGLPELYLCGAKLWRRGMAEVFTEWVDRDSMSLADARRYIELIAHGNANRAYQLRRP